MLTQVMEVMAVRSTEVMELTSVKAEVLSLRRRWRFDSHRELTEVTDGAIDRGDGADRREGGGNVTVEAVTLRLPP